MKKTTFDEMEVTRGESAPLLEERRLLERGESLKKAIERALWNFQDSTDVASIERVVQLIETSLEDEDESFWSFEDRDAVEHFVLMQRFSHPAHYKERMVLIQRLEELMEIDIEEWSREKKVETFLGSIDEWNTDLVEELEPFLERVMPILDLYQSDKRAVITTLLYGLAKREAKNPHFIEQVQALTRWGFLNTEQQTDAITNWTTACVRAEGLLFDPGTTRPFMESTSGVSQLDKLLNASTAISGFAPKKATDLPSLAAGLTQIYFSEGFSSSSVDFLVEAPVSTQEKFQLLKNILHYGLCGKDSEEAGIMSEDIDHDFDRYHDSDDQEGLLTPSEERVRAAKIASFQHFSGVFLDCLERLSLTPAQKQELIQEMHITAFYKTGFLPDPVGILPRIDLTHPVIRSWRLERTKQGAVSARIMQDLEPAVGRVTPLQADMLCVLNWTKEEQEQFLLPFGTPFERKSFLRRIRELTVHDMTLAESLMDQFRAFEPRVPRRSDEQLGLQGLICFWDKIPEWCARVPEFQEAYDQWMANRFAAGYAPTQGDLTALESYPSMHPESWSEGVCREIVMFCVNKGNWEEISTFVQNYPHFATILQRQERISCGIKLNEFRRQRAMRDNLEWLQTFIVHRPALLAEFVSERADFDEFYQEAVALLYSMPKNKNADHVIRNAPAISSSHPAIQKAIAERVIGQLTVSFATGRPKGLAQTGSEAIPKASELNDLVPHADWVNWKGSEARSATTEAMVAFIGEHTYSQKRETAAAQNYLAQVAEIERITGYQVTDEFYLWEQLKQDHWNSEIDSFTTLLNWVEDWCALHETLNRPLDQERFQNALQVGLDRLCVEAEISIADIKQFQTRHHIVPSAQAVRERIIHQLSTEGVITDGLELVHQLGVSIELTLEDLKTLAPVSARAEAIIYTSMLPKKGKERLEAERLFRARSGLSDFIPDLLAVQGPSKRAEFCPYEQGLAPLLGYRDEFDYHPEQKSAFDLSQERVRRGLLVFLRRFGMYNLPLLAQSVIELVSKSEEGKVLIETADPVLEVLNEFLEVKEPRLKLEEYFTRIEHVTTAMRTALLEDRPLDPRIERSALGMELFNITVPHVGAYQEVKDRPSLIASTRVNAEKLELGPMYAPAAFPILVGLEQSADESMLFSPTDQAIRKQQELIDRKYYDETLQKFLQSWNRAFVLSRMESSGASRRYWFNALEAYWQRERKERVETLEKTTRPEARINLTKKIEVLDASLQRVGTLMKRAFPQEDDSLVTPALLLEELQSLFVSASGKIDRVKLETEAGTIARALCLLIMKDHSPAHYRAVSDAAQNASGQGTLSREQVDAWECWFREEYLQHFAQLKNEAQVPLTSSAHALFQKLWRIDGLQGAIQARFSEPSVVPIGHPIIDPFTVIEHAEKEIRVLEDRGIQRETQEMTFWPTKRLGRVLAGDIANACFHRHRQDLARGSYPNLTAILMTLPGRTEITGSTLFIDAVSETGRRALVIRALNPTESIVHQLDAEALVEATIAYAKTVVEAEEARGGMPFQEIRLCMDGAGGHSTNREDIANAEQALQKKYGWSHGWALKQTPETNFNGYRIWQAEQTRVVWSREGLPS